MSEQNEQTLDKYEIQGELGSGGFATVYHAVDTTLDREVALKVLSPTLSGDPAFLGRFRQEAKVTAKLLHPNIAALFEIGEAEGRHFIAMQYVPGRNLQDMARDRGLLPLDEIVAIVRQIGTALDYAHGRKAIHRDVKPSNIIVDDDDSAILTDFGIVKALESTSIHTTTGAILGTPRYASPEQADSKPLDGRSDLYSLGVVAYELIVGKVPFIADTTPSLFYKIVHEEPVLPSKINPRAAGPIEQVLLKALAKQPGDRYQNGKEFATALDVAVEQTKGQMVDSIYQEAVELFGTDDLDSAESNLRRVLAIDPSHTQAKTFLDRVGERREFMQRYQGLVDHVNQARAEAEELEQSYPDANDPKGVIRILTSDLGSKAFESVLEKPDEVSSLEHEHRVTVLKKQFSILRIIATFLIIVSVIVVVIGWVHANNTQYNHAVAREIRSQIFQAVTGNLIFGIGLGVGVASLALLIFLWLTGRKQN